MKQIILKKTMNIILIFVFVGIITVPFLGINQDPNKISVTQNRGLAKRPYMKESGNLTNYINGFNAYINDNIGFREEATIFRIAQMYRLFQKIDIPSWIEGKQGHIFYTNGGKMIQTFQGQDLLTQEQLKQFADTLSAMKNYFELTGAKFYFMTIPDKEQIYPEYYPDTILRYVNDTKIGQLNKYLKNYEINAFDMKEPLLQAKDIYGEFLYYKSVDASHWNMNGAFVGYQEIMKHLKKDFPQLKVFSKDDFNITSKPVSGTIWSLDSIDAINKAYNWEDIYYSYSIPNAQAIDTKTIPEGIQFKYGENYYHFENKNNPKAPKALIIGDSYIYQCNLPMLAESFSDTYFVGVAEKPFDVETITDLQSKVNADIVLYEMVERVFNYDSCIDYLEQFHELAPVNFPYQNLKIENIPTDFFIDVPINENGILKVEKSSGTYKIMGWALDKKANDLWGDIYAKLGNNYYKAERYERPDITKLNENFLMSGFYFQIPESELLKNSEIEFIVISTDKSFQYAPIKYRISTK